ncbi:MAG TPA: hypothetical protein VLA03_02110 [Draconibacterium sp.]|nr:hypothetical protein [Draconibacterium sp.]
MIINNSIRFRVAGSVIITFPELRTVKIAKYDKNPEVGSTPDSHSK